MSGSSVEPRMRTRPRGESVKPAKRYRRCGGGGAVKKTSRSRSRTWGVPERLRLGRVACASARVLSVLEGDPDGLVGPHGAREGRRADLEGGAAEHLPRPQALARPA